jgi:hypothetical protein
MMERRAQPRTKVSWEARVANVSEAVPATVDVIDVSFGGALVAFCEPVGLLRDERVVLSLEPNGTPMMLLGRVVRVARGTDFRTYVAVQFSDNQDAELERLTAELDELNRIDSSAPGAG